MLHQSVTECSGARHGSVRAGRICAVLLLLAAVTAALAPVFRFPGDGAFAGYAAEVENISRNLERGIFPVYMDFEASNGAGFASGLRAQNILFTPAALLVTAGVSAATALHLLTVGFGLFGAFSAAFAAWSISRSGFAAFAAGMLYGVSAWGMNLVFVYFRLPVFYAGAFVPWVLLGCGQLIRSGKPAWGAFAFGWAGILAADLSAAAVTGVFCGALMLAEIHVFAAEPRRLLLAAGALVTALGVNAFYLLPLWEECAAGNLAFPTAEAFCGEGAAPPLRLIGEFNPAGMPAGVGVIVAAAALQRFRFASDGSREMRFMDDMLIAGALALLAATDFLPWENLSGLRRLIGGPWRLCLPATAALAIGGALALHYAAVQGKISRRGWIFWLLAGCLSVWGFALERSLNAAPPPRQNPAAEAAALPEEPVPVTGAAGIGVSGRSCRALELEYVKVPGPACHVELPLRYYCGWSAVSDDGVPVEVTAGPHGGVMLELPIETASGRVTAIYTGSRLLHTGGAVSVCLLAFGGAAWAAGRLKRGGRKKSVKKDENINSKREKC